MKIIAVTCAHRTKVVTILVTISVETSTVILQWKLRDWSIEAHSQNESSRIFLQNRVKTRKL